LRPANIGAGHGVIFGENVMKSTALKVLLFASVLAPVAVFGQNKPDTATIITKEMIDTINQQEQDRPTLDENAMVVDLGYEHFSVGVIHRGSTRNPPPARPAGAANANAPAPTPCGRQMASVPAGAIPAMPAPGGPNGPTCGGSSVGSRKVELKVGDIMIAPPGVVHGWADIPDHVDYLSFRPSQHVMQAGWVNPRIASMVNK
jgi:hypothetical protein